MKLIFLFIYLLFGFDLYADSISEKLEIYVDLWPAGDFKAVSNKIKGQVHKEGTKYWAKNVRIPVKSIDTGIELRNTHLQQRLNAEKDPNSSVVLVEASGEVGKGTATFMVNNITDTVPFTFEEISKNFIKAKFKINFATFKIPDLKYMGVGVQDIAQVEVIIPLKEK